MDFKDFLIGSVRDFLGRTSDYSLVTGVIDVPAGSPSSIGIDYMSLRSGYSYFVAYSTINNLYLIFFYFNTRLGLMVSTNWDSSKDIFYQDDIIYNGFYNNISDYTRATTGRIYNKNYAYYIPMPVLNGGEKLVGNYSSSTNTVMFSSLDLGGNRFDGFNTYFNLSHSVCFGNLSKYGNWDGGFYYGGDSVWSLELYMRFSVSRNSDGDLTNNHLYSDIFWISESSCVRGLDFHVRGYWPWESSIAYQRTWYDNPYLIVNTMPVGRLPNTINDFNKFHCFLRIDMDYAPHRPENINKRMLPIINSRPCDDEDLHTFYNIQRNQIWATTLDIDWYVKMIVSIDNTSGGVPSYWPLLPATFYDTDHTTNTLNNISLIMKLYFMVMRDPPVLNEYSAVGYTDIINFANMKNMSTNSIHSGQHGCYFNCFHMGLRRDYRGMKGYCGLAFRL